MVFDNLVDFSVNSLFLLLKLISKQEGAEVGLIGQLFCRCGYATLHHVIDKSKEDRMESFFLSETCKYLYLVSVLEG